MFTQHDIGIQIVLSKSPGCTTVSYFLPSLKKNNKIAKVTVNLVFWEAGNGAFTSATSIAPKI